MMNHFKDAQELRFKQRYSRAIVGNDCEDGLRGGKDRKRRMA